MRVGSSDVIHMQVPVHFINEDISVGVKSGGLVSHLMNSIEVICKAKDLPEFLQVDIAELKEGESLHLSDVVMPKGVTVAALTHGEDHDLPVVSIHTPRGGGAEEEEAAEGEAAEGEAAE
jgi:large subunit ribosomal protein L25